MTEVLRIPDKLVPVFEGEADIRGSYGGRGSGKTRTFALMTAVWAYKFAEAGMSGQILCGREFMNSLDDSSFHEIKLAIMQHEWLADYFELGEKFIRTKNKRIQYTFSGLRHSIDSIKSKSRILLCWVDEAEAVREDAWIKLMPTIREEGSEVWVTWNPERRDSATHVRFREQADDDMKIVEMNFRDNPWFPTRLERERLRDKANRPEVYGHIWEGEFLEYITGAILQEQMLRAKTENRITTVPVVDTNPVWGFFDIGNSDGTAIWLVQKVGVEYRIIDFIEGWGEPYSHYVKILKDRGYNYETMYLPHDAEHKRQGQSFNKSPQMMLQELMPSVDWEIVPRVSDIWVGINQLRDSFSQLWFDKDRCKLGIEHLRQYRRKWSENERRWLDKPDKSEGHSEAADALRQFAQALANNQLDASANWGELNYETSYVV